MWLLLLSATLAVLAVLASAASAASAAVAPKPNFVFILGDDWGYGDVGAYRTLLNHGIDQPATPNLDRMAKEGTTFWNFHTLGAECSPSRASWMTGRSPSDKAVGINLVIGNHETNVGKGCADWVNLSTPTVFSTMSKAGYSVGHFGKWHMGDSPANATAGIPAAPSLDKYGIDSFKCYVCNAPDPESTIHLYATSDMWFPSNSSKLIVGDAIKFISAAQAEKKPFYLNVRGKALIVCTRMFVLGCLC